MPKLRTLAALICLPLTLSACSTYVPDTYVPDSYASTDSYGYDSTYGSPSPMPTDNIVSYGSGDGAASNGPVIEELDAMPSNTLVPGQTVTLRAEAFSRQGLLAYHWAATDGLLESDAGKSVRWTAPDAAGICQVTLTIQDTSGEVTTGTVNLRVLDASTAIATPSPVSTPTPWPDGFETPTPMPTWSDAPLPTPTPFPTWFGTPAPTPTPFETPTPMPSAIATPAPGASATPSPLPSERSEERHHARG